MEHSAKIKKLKEACVRLNDIATHWENELKMSIKYIHYLAMHQCEEKEISAELNSALEVLTDITEIIENEQRDPAWFISQKIALKEFSEASEKLDLIFKHISITCIIPFSNKERTALYFLNDVTKLIREMEKN